MPDEGQSLLALAEQRRKQASARLNQWVCSAQYKWDLALEAKKVSIHAVLRGIEERPGEICGLAYAPVPSCGAGVTGTPLPYTLAEHGHKSRYRIRLMLGAPIERTSKSPQGSHRE